MGTSAAWVREIGENKGGSDEWYTPPEAVYPLLQYIKPGSKILCPFDTAESEFVKILGNSSNIVLHSHISEGVDFFTLDKPDVDYIISNPPYSKRMEILEKLYSWDIPFAMIFNGNGLFDHKRRFQLAQSGIELLYLYPRVKFIDSTGSRNSPPFTSMYWCKNFLPEKVVFCNMNEDYSQIGMFDEV